MHPVAAASTTFKMLMHSGTQIPSSAPGHLSASVFCVHRYRAHCLYIDERAKICCMYAV